MTTYRFEWLRMDLTLDLNWFGTVQSFFFYMDESRSQNRLIASGEPRYMVAWPASVRGQATMYVASPAYMGSPPFMGSPPYIQHQKIFVKNTYVRQCRIVAGLAGQRFCLSWNNTSVDLWTQVLPKLERHDFSNQTGRGIVPEVGCTKYECLSPECLTWRKRLLGFCRVARQKEQISGIGS